MDAEVELLNQHLIDPEICIRCNTCEATCPIGAVTHDDRNYVVKADVCNACMACIPPCPTGAIDNWRKVARDKAYTIEEQLSWDSLPAPLGDEVREVSAAPVAQAQPELAPAPRMQTAAAMVASAWNATVPPWSAAHAYTNLYAIKAPTSATVVGNYRVTAAHTESDIRHVMLDFGNMPFPVLEGQSIGIVPPGNDESGRPHAVRQYSVASPRNGERAGYNNLSLTVKRVTVDHDGKPVRGVCSNYICDLKVGDIVSVVGPFGATFLMPNHPRSNIVMICTGTGSAPMRAMTEWRRRLRNSGKFEGGTLMLFFGARTPDELPYFGPLMKLPGDFIDINLAFSRVSGTPKQYVQDLMRVRGEDLGSLLRNPDTYVYVCGLRSMEDGVLRALRDVAEQAGLTWDSFGVALKREGRLHLETY
ncbi:MAG TPA: benzoyl-CoA 2,3-epoxidase subunit BoxA [Burkholderiales bacterium]|nr:benzoyl-CoA 2,3-epoxidase subunit BoxA [Burkholderiales bacterium]